MNETATVSRTYRAAIKLGDDYITLEETICLPPTATNDEIAQAVETGLRIYHIQHKVMQEQIQMLRDQQQYHTNTPRMVDPESPASDKQRSYLEYLMTTLNISEDAINSMFREHQTTYDTLTKGVASEIIDHLKSQLDTRPSVQSTAHKEEKELSQGAEGNSVPVSTRQLAALRRLGSKKGRDVEQESQQQYGVPLEELTSIQAGEFLQALQD